MDLENAEEILQILERYTKQKSKTIPDELNGYLSHVALTGDSVYNWSKVQYFFREKLAHVLKDFHDTTPRTEDLPVSRNVDAFNYDTMKTILLERFDLFNAAPFTIQRLCELLNEPKKHYCRLDKYMRALEKNILVVSTVEPGHRQMGSENGDSINGDPLMDINVDVEMDKEPSSSCVQSSLIDQKSIEPEPIIEDDDTSTQNKTEPTITTEPTDELINDDADVNTNGHHNTDELNDTIEDPKVDDDESVESIDKADNNASTSVETITVDVQPAVIAEKVNSPEVDADASKPIPDTPSHIITEVAAKETISEAVQPLDGAEPAVISESVEEKPSEVISESAKHSLDRDDDDDDDEEFQPTAAKLPKIDESLTPVDAAAVPDTERIDVAKIDIAPSNETVSSEDQPDSEVKETLSEAVLLEEEDIAPIVETEPLVEQQIVDEKIVAGESATVDVDPTIVANRSDDVDVATVPIPDIEPVLQSADPIDDANNDTTSTDNTISPLASTLSNDLDVLEEDEDELIEPIMADAEQNLLDPVTLPEPDIEMMPSTDAEQMAVEEPTPVLAATSSDLAMDATQIIPPTNDEQMDVFENNSMDQDL